MGKNRFCVRVTMEGIRVRQPATVIRSGYTGLEPARKLKELEEKSNFELAKKERKKESRIEPSASIKCEVREDLFITIRTAEERRTTTEALIQFLKNQTCHLYLTMNKGIILMMFVFVILCITTTMAGVQEFAKFPAVNYHQARIIREASPQRFPGWLFG
ncbi:hypothetical protein OUZ56_019233 [Daphnia magna]|uniref:Uncharacterized protein n=1 Tax=Daphnia magna TaxID=35525 RepID=A0ABQ9ZBT6_9CRUS|nr:hypothetical protein OUZ56_019233 [Daphnia magna]